MSEQFSTTMITIEDSVEIHAPVTVVFDAERNITLHAATQGHRGERAVGGVTRGLIELGQEVEWEARHFGIRQRLRVGITEMDRPRFFCDEMIRGAFKSLHHEHHFKELAPGRTEKRDVMSFQAPLGPLGWLAERLFLRSYMLTFLRRKNRDLKRLVETMDMDPDASGTAGRLGAEAPE